MDELQKTPKWWMTAGTGLLAVAVLAVVSACGQSDRQEEAPGPVQVAEVMVCPEITEPAPNQWIAFRRDFSVEKVPSKAVARIAADSKYWLWVNGQLAVFEGSLKRGPTPEGAYYDQIDLAPYLQPGENRLALLQWYFGKEGFSHKDSGRAQLWFSCPALGVVTDDGWLCRVHPAYGTAVGVDPNFRLPESNLSFDARKDIEGWQTGPADGFRPALKAPNTLGTLWPRPIPQWKDFGIREIAFETHPGADFDTLVARLPHNMQMTPIIRVSDPDGGHRIILETDHMFVGAPCLWADYFTKAGDQEYESLGWLNGLTLNVIAQHGARVTGISYRETGYDTEQDGRFNCNDPFFNRLWEKGLRTIYVNARDTFFDCPDRERAQWWGDIVTILGECFYTYSPSLHLLVRKGLWELADWQREDGALHAPVPAGNYDSELPVQMLAAIGKYGLWTYYLNTGDRETLAHVYPAAKKYLALYPLEESGLTAWRDTEWNWGDWGQERDQRLLQALWFCLATEGMAYAAEVLDLPEDIALYRTLHDSVTEAVNRVCWTGQAYRHPDYEGETDDRVQALAIVAGVATPDKYAELYRTLREEEHASPYMEKYVMEALFMLGRGDYALERVRRRYAGMVNNSAYDTLFEHWEKSNGSVNHAWTGGPLSVLPARMFGIVPLEASWKRFSVSPDPAIFDDCTLSFNTVAGTVAMDFSREENDIQWVVTVPAGSEALLHIPWNYTQATLDRKALHTKELTLRPGKHMLRISLPGGIDPWKAGRLQEDMPMSLTGELEGKSPEESLAWYAEMTRLSGDGRFADALERVLYNTPLPAGEYVYGVQEQVLQLNTYASGTTSLPWGGKEVTLVQKTDYPWYGDVRLTLALRGWVEGQLRLHIPAWCRRYSLKVNGEPFDAPAENGYAVVNRRWNDGDELSLKLEMPVEVISADPRRKECAGYRAVQRGPLLYCLARADNTAVDYDALRITDDAVTQTRYVEDKLGGIVEIEAFTLGQRLILVPYYARKGDTMKVWIPVEQ